MKECCKEKTHLNATLYVILIGVSILLNVKITAKHLSNAMSSHVTWHRVPSCEITAYLTSCHDVIFLMQCGLILILGHVGTSGMWAGYGFFPVVKPLVILQLIFPYQQ